MKTVKLKTGIEVSDGLVAVVTSSLKDLLKAQPIAFYELVMLCRDPKHQLFGTTAQTLRKYALLPLEADQPHDAVREIILAAAEGEGLDMVLSSPVA